MQQEQESTVRLAQGSHSPSQAGAERAADRPIRGCLRLIVGGLGYLVRCERVLIGRAAHCRVVVDDPLVSREHALISVSATAAVIDDLDSANGTWVNDSRILGTQPLNDGDRIRVGTQELRVCASETRDSMPPASSVQSKAPSHFGAAEETATEPADALLVLGRIAARQLAEGDPLAAEASLRDQLGKLLVATSMGLAISPSACEAAGKQALLLALALREPRWVEYVVKLHLRTRLTVSPAVASLLEEGLATIPGVDEPLLEDYLEMLDNSELSGEDRRLLDRLRAQKPGR
ncbi:MAG: FHA domain-containing protein [Polyangiaceae bacterium]|nr:FHA domain-containing protein [Polyangiaceae bacterium]